MSVFEPRVTLKPYDYSWAVEATKKQQRIHWIAEEVPMSKDVKDWHTKLSEPEKNLARNIMLLFTQSDIDVGNGYLDHYMERIKNPEIRFMLTTFAAQEVIHVLAYSYLMETLGFKDEDYSEFMNYKAMLDKHESVMAMKSDDLEEFLVTMATFGAFIEGLQLFASFIMLLNFQRSGKLKGMGQIVAWSVRDETLHCHSICRLYKTILEENRDVVDVVRIREKVRENGKKAVEHEDAFIDKAFEFGEVEGLSPDQVKSYIRYVADRRFEMLDIEPEYGQYADPQPWFEEMIGGVEHVNFFENRSTAYAKAASSGEEWF